MFEFDEKGKIFTDIVRKEPVLALIALPGYFVRGQIYVHPEKRIKDELDETSDFLAVTDAAVSDSAGQVLYRTEFLAVGKRQILWVIPVDDLAAKEAQK